MDGTITIAGTLSGALSANASLSGALSGNGSLSGALSLGEGVVAPIYEGSYTVTPKAHTEQVLATDGKLMEDDVTVFEIPYFETSNLSGTTVYIANEVEVNG